MQSNLLVAVGSAQPFFWQKILQDFLRPMQILLVLTHWTETFTTVEVFLAFSMMLPAKDEL